MGQSIVSYSPPGSAAWPGVSISFQLCSEGSPLRQVAYPQNLVNRVSACQPEGRGRRRKVFLGPRHVYSPLSWSCTRASLTRRALQSVQVFLRPDEMLIATRCVYTPFVGMNFSHNNSASCWSRILFPRFGKYPAFFRAHETRCLEFSLGRVNSVHTPHFLPT